MQHQRCILAEYPIAGYQAHGFSHGLGNQHVIKRIIVMPGECCQHFRMSAEKRQLHKAAFLRGCAKSWQMDIQLNQCEFL